MKILIVASTTVHIKNFHIPYIEEMKKRGHTVLVMANGEGADFNIPFKKRTLSLKNLFLTSKIKKIIKKERFDRILLHTTLAAFYVRLALKGMKNRPYVINTVHGYLFSENSSSLKRKVYLSCERLLKKQTDVIVTMNQQDYKIATENKLCLGNVYNTNGMGVKKMPRGTYKPSDDMLRLTFVGEISRRKNQIFLVNALKLLPNATLTLVGDGDERRSLESFAKKNGLSDRLKITGFTSEKQAYFESTDIYVSASSIEGLPFNIMEAMCFGLPIVASDIKGQRDLLPSDCLYEYGNEQAFVKAVNEKELKSVEYDTEKYELENVIDYNLEIYLK